MMNVVSIISIFLHSLIANITFYTVLLGWGYICNIFIKGNPTPHPGKLAVTGAAFIICLGGYLIYYKANPISLIIILIVGFIGMIVFIIKESFTIEFRKIPLAIWFSLVVILWRVGLSVWGGLNWHDDFHGYMQLPVRIFQTGTLAADIFNERRMGVLGGGAYLQSLYLNFVPLSWIAGLDKGVGILLILGAIVSTCSNILYNKKGAAILVLCAIIDFSSVNITFVYINAAILILLISEVTKINSDTKADIFVMAMLSASCITTKNFMVGPVVFLSLIYVINQWSHINTFKITTPAMYLALVIILLCPWLLLSYNSCGTLLFPLTGIGYNGSRYGLLEIVNNTPTSFPNLIHYLLKFLIMPENIICLTYLTVTKSFRNTKQDKILFASILLTVICAWLIVWKAMFLIRYAKTISGAAAVFVLLLYYKRNRIKLIIVCLIIMTAINYSSLANHYLPNFHEIEDRHIQLILMKSTMLSMQASIPKDAALAVFVSHPFLLDFARNKVHVFDHYGGACPPPGLPLKDPQLLKKYLLTHGISYLAYSYGNEANYGRRVYADRLKSDGSVYGERLKKIALFNFGFQEMLISLRNTEKIVFDDGTQFVLNLASKQ